MSATVILEIDTYLPAGYDFNGFSFNFKSDDKSCDSTIEVNLI
jgi:hypothetical protein